jgi:hypothetical protein
MCTPEDGEYDAAEYEESSGFMESWQSESMGVQIANVEAHRTLSLTSAKLQWTRFCHQLCASDYSELDMDRSSPVPKFLDGSADDVRAAVRDKASAHDQFGLLSIAVTHPCNFCFIDFVFKLFPLLVLSAQVALPFCIWHNMYHGNESTCHLSDGSRDKKVTMFFLALYYIVKLAMISVPKILFNTDGFYGLVNLNAVMDVQGYFRDGGYDLTMLFSPLARFMLFDEFMQGPYEYLLYMLNLYVVWHTPDLVEMVLNAVAFEFIMKLDEEYKTLYMKTNGACVSGIIRDEWLYNYEDLCSVKVNLLLNIFVGITEILTSTTSTIVILGFLTVGAICKM